MFLGASVACPVPVLVRDRALGVNTARARGRRGLGEGSARALQGRTNIREFRNFFLEGEQREGP